MSQADFYNHILPVWLRRTKAIRHYGDRNLCSHLWCLAGAQPGRVDRRPSEIGNCVGSDERTAMGMLARLRRLNAVTFERISFDGQVLPDLCLHVRHLGGLPLDESSGRQQELFRRVPALLNANVARALIPDAMDRLSTSILSQSAKWFARVILFCFTDYESRTAVFDVREVVAFLGMDRAQPVIRGLDELGRYPTLARIRRYSGRGRRSTRYVIQFEPEIFSAANRRELAALMLTVPSADLQRLIGLAGAQEFVPLAGAVDARACSNGVQLRTEGDQDQAVDARACSNGVQLRTEGDQDQAVDARACSNGVQLRTEGDQDQAVDARACSNGVQLRTEGDQDQAVDARACSNGVQLRTEGDQDQAVDARACSNGVQLRRISATGTERAHIHNTTKLISAPMRHTHRSTSNDQASAEGALPVLVGDPLSRGADDEHPLQTCQRIYNHIAATLGDDKTDPTIIWRAAVACVCLGFPRRLLREHLLSVMRAKKRRQIKTSPGAFFLHLMRGSTEKLGIRDGGQPLYGEAGSSHEQEQHARYADLETLA